MVLTSLQVCMDSTDWLQGTIHDETGIDSSSPSGDMLTCSRPLIERRLRPPHDQALKCPRCDSTHTKFCYYNNYSLSQPRYFCKTCRRYWTKGGTLRNIPVGGGCRKNKKVSTKKSNNNDNHNIHDQPINHINPSSSSSSFHVHNITNPTDLQLSFPDQIQISHLNHLLTTQGTLANPSLGFLENSARPIDFMESKLEAIVGSSRNSNYDFMGNGDIGMVSGYGEIDHHHHHNHGLTSTHQSFPFEISSLDGNNNNNNNSNGNFMETCQRLMVPYDHHHHHHHHEDQNMIDVKPNTKFLSLEWQDQGCSDNGYLNHLGSWTGVINGYGSSTTTNPLV